MGVRIPTFLASLTMLIVFTQVIAIRIVLQVIIAIGAAIKTVNSVHVNYHTMTGRDNTAYICVCTKRPGISCQREQPG